MEKTNGTSVPGPKGFDAVAWTVAVVCAIAVSVLVTLGFYGGIPRWFCIFSRGTAATYRFAIGETAMVAACAFFYLAGRGKIFFPLSPALTVKILFGFAISNLLLATLNFLSFSVW